MTALPTRKHEDWRYSDHVALGEAWPLRLPAARTIDVAVGETRAVTERLGSADLSGDDVVVTVGDGGRLTLAVAQTRAADAVTMQLYTLAVGADAHVRIDILNSGSRFGRIALDVTLGARATFELGGLILGRGDQTLEIVTTLRHVAPGAVSRQTVRVVVNDRATGSFLGKVAVAREGQQTDAAQSVKALLLSRTATANARPELEIFADDVKCAHGATVGELDRQALFYLASRGVGPAEATALLTEAFLGDAGLPEMLYEEAIAWLRA